MTGIIPRLVEAGAAVVSVIGLAKNTGKTVTLNTLAEEAHEAGLKTAFVSFGRDGEAVDAITRLNKPRIRVFPGSLFVTAEGFINPAVVDTAAEEGTGIHTVFGEVKVYTCGAAGGRAELIGINKVSTLRTTLDLLKGRANLVLIDGALDRRSSAVPVFSDACVLAAGAVLGRTEEAVVRHTEAALARLRVPAVEDPALRAAAESLYAEDRAGVVLFGGDILKPEDPAAAAADPSVKALILRGALTDAGVLPLLQRRRPKELAVVVKDPTRIFLSGRVMKRLENRNIRVQVLKPVRVVALTVNPVRPFGEPMDSARLVETFRSLHPDLICCDVMADRQGLSIT